MWDYFFYYDNINVPAINKNDMFQILLQPAKSMYYNRSYGVETHLNFPQAGFNQLLLAYSIANAISKRNLSVTDGSNGFQDRRVAVSQSFIQVEDGAVGERNLNVYYFNYQNYKTPDSIKTVV